MKQAARTQSQSTCRDAFTLIELLVVMSIVSLLLGVLLPAMGRARSLAKQTLCRSRLRQWGMAFELYAGQNENTYPHIDGRDRIDQLPQNPAPEDTADWYFGWIDVLPPLMGDRPWRDYDYGRKPDADTLFQCPSARFAPDKLYKYRPRNDGYFSYAMNSCLELDKNCWPPHGAKGDNWHMPSFLNTASIRQPSRIILLFDQLLDPRKGYGGRKYNATAGKYCGSYPKAFSARHAKPAGVTGGFILYCDYHVEGKESVWKPHWPEGLEVPPRDDPDWYPY